MGKRKKKPAKKKSPKKPSKYTAATADKHELYELSVQSPETDIEFLQKLFREARGFEAKHLREDFCGTGLMTSHWIRLGDEFTAEGFDIDRATIDYGIEKHFSPLGDVAKQAALHEADVREPSNQPPDIRSAQNFSYNVFKKRSDIKAYFQAAYDDLPDHGLFVIDAHGGSEVYEAMEEETEVDEGFTYVWDQDEYWPVTHEAVNYIHFHFPDGTKMRKAFRYEWRIWTLMELREIFEEVGFKQVDAYWEGTDEDGESGDGEFTITELGENDLSWIAYLVAVK